MIRRPASREPQVLLLKSHSDQPLWNFPLVMPHLGITGRRIPMWILKISTRAMFSAEYLEQLTSPAFPLSPSQGKANKNQKEKSHQRTWKLHIVIRECSALSPKLKYCCWFGFSQAEKRAARSPCALQWAWGCAKQAASRVLPALLHAHSSI